MAFRQRTRKYATFLRCRKEGRDRIYNPPLCFPGSIGSLQLFEVLWPAVGKVVSRKKKPELVEWQPRPVVE